MEKRKFDLLYFVSWLTLGCGLYAITTGLLSVVRLERFPYDDKMALSLLKKIVVGIKDGTISVEVASARLFELTNGLKLLLRKSVVLLIWIGVLLSSISFCVLTLLSKNRHNRSG